MIPVLYAANATDFTTNGIGRISECTYCTVTEVRNGIFELELQIPTTAKYFGKIEEERIIVAQPRPGSSGQPFRIWNITKPLNGVVTVYARHISYELNKIVAMPFTAESCAAAFVAMKSAAATTCPFDFWTDKVVSATMNVKQPTEMRGLLGGQQGSILDVYGTGEYEFDGYTVKLHQNRGVDRGVSIRYGKNLTALEDSTDTSNVYTGIVPYYHSDIATVVLPERVLWGEHRYDYPYGMTKAVDFTSNFETTPTVAQLRAAAQSYINKSTGWQINNNIKVSFVNLADTEEYKSTAALQRVNLCDTVTVVHPALNIEATAKVVKVVYDCINERYVSMELGATRTNLSQAITEEIMETVPTTSMMQEAIDHANKMITGGLGGYILFNFNANGQPEELLIMNTPDKATATSVWRWNLGGLGHGSSYDTPATDVALTADGRINASMITTGKLNANIIQTGIIKGVQGSMQINVDTGTITLGDKALRITAGNFKLDSAGNVTITGKLSNGKPSYSSTQNGVYVGTDGISIGNFRGGSSGTGFRAAASGRVEVGCISFYTGNGTDTAQYGLWAKNNGTHIGSGGPCDFNSDGDGTANKRNYLRNGTTLYGGVDVYAGMWMSGDLRFDSSHDYMIDDVNEIYASGKITCEQVIQTSDERRKEDITDLEKSEEFILALRPVRFKFKERDGYHHGFIAQEVLEALQDDNDIVTEDKHEMYGISYTEIIADLVGICQKQQQRINDLEQRLASIEALLEGDGK